MSSAVRIPHWGWWVAIVGGMSLTAWIAFSGNGYLLWCNLATAVVPQAIFQWIFWLAMLAHVLEAAYAFRIAEKNGEMNSVAWALQTLILGYPSLRLLKSG